MSEGEQPLKDNDSVSIPIPKKLYEKISQEIGSKSPQAVSKYVIYIVERALSSEEKKVYSAEDKKKIKERLSRLGYF